MLNNNSEGVKVEPDGFYNTEETEDFQDNSNDSTVMPTENVLNGSLDDVKMEPDGLCNFGDFEQLQVAPVNSDSVKNVENSSKPFEK